MTVEDQIGYLQSKIASLEAKLASLESQGDDPTTEGRLHTSPHPTVDPKGRKIWESEWRGDYGVMMAYVPNNALIVDGTNVTVEADDKEGDEVTLADGSWYLHVYKNETTGNWEAELDQEQTGTREDEEAKYNIRICDIHEDGYVEKQYVTGSIVIGASGVTSLTGDGSLSQAQPSEKIDGDVEVTGKLDPEDDSSSCGIEFVTVSKREAQGEDLERPARMIAQIKGRESFQQGWGAHKLTIKGKDGASDTEVHVLGNRDATIDPGGGQGEKNANVIGSDYINVGDETDAHGVTKRKVSAKIDTPDPQPVPDPTAEPPVLPTHALLTHDTDQLVRSKKTFIGSFPLANSKKVIVDGPNGMVEVKDATGNKTIKLDADDIPNDCGGELKVHKLKFKDEKGVEHTYHGLFCADIDLTKEGKLIKSTTVTASAAPNGMNTIKFIYTDGTYDEFKVMNGMDGSPGSPGKDGDTPEITAERKGNHVYIYADGDLIATIEDGQTPQITAQKVGKITTIYADGVPIATINDGEDGQGGGGELKDATVITGISFEFSTDNKKLKANVTKQKVKVVLDGEPTTESVDVMDADTIDVVVASTYNKDGDVSFKNVLKKVKVLEVVQDAGEDTVFTTTPHSEEPSA